MCSRQKATMQFVAHVAHQVRRLEPRLFQSTQWLLRDVVPVRNAYSRPWFLNASKALRKPPTTVHKFPESGDQAPAVPVKGDELVPVLRDSKLLENVPGRVRQLYTLAFATGKERMEFRRREMCKQCGVDEADKESLAAQIVSKTLEIRTGYEHVARNHKDRRGVRRIRRKIAERTELIHKLLEVDGAQVRRICEALRLEYTPPGWPVPAQWLPTEMQQRKAEVVREAMRTRSDKLSAYREALEAELRRFETRRTAQVTAIDAELRSLSAADGAQGGARELLAQVVTERRERAMQVVYEDRYARLLNLYERGVQAKEEAARAHAELRESKITERLAKLRQTLAQSGAAQPAASKK